MDINNNILLAKHPEIAILMNIGSILISFIENLEFGLKLFALMLSIIVAILTIISKVIEIRIKNKELKNKSWKEKT